MALDFNANLKGNDHLLHDTHVVSWGKLKLVEIAKGLKQTLAYMDYLGTLPADERNTALLVGRENKGCLS